jgi:hypothetical protein
VCGNWFGLADSLHMPQPAVAGGRGREWGRSFQCFLGHCQTQYLPATEGERHGGTWRTMHCLLCTEYPWYVCTILGPAL